MAKRPTGIPAKIKFTQRQLERLPMAETTDDTYAVSDTEVTQLKVRVSTNSKTFILNGRIPYRRSALKKSLDLTLADLEMREWTIDNLRQHALQVMGEFKHRGDDKRLQRHLYDDIAQEVFKLMKADGVNDKYYTNVKTLYDTYIFPRIGGEYLDNVEKAMITELFHEISDAKSKGPKDENDPKRYNSKRGNPRHWARGNSALRFMKRVSRLGLTDFNVGRDTAAGIKKHPDIERNVTFTEEEWKLVWENLRTDHLDDLVIRMHMVTGSRPIEIMRSKKEDFKGDVWVKPSQHTKMRREHTVSLPSLAQQVVQWTLAAAHKVDPDSEYMFPTAHGTSTGPHKKDYRKAWTRIQKILPQLKGKNVYDFRTTVASMLANQGHNEASIMAITGHTSPSVMIKHYIDIAQDKKKELAEAIIPKGVN